MTSPTKVFTQLANTAAQPAAAAAGGSPFASLLASLPQSGWANPNAQAWTQQALSAPFMQGWSQPTAAPGAAPGAGAPTTGAPLTAEQFAPIQQALSQQGKAQQASVYGGFLSGLATGGPVGALTSLATSAFTANKDGWYGTGIDGSWAKKTLAEYGYRTQAIPKGGTVTIGPDGKKHYGNTYAIKALFDIMNQYGITPKKT